MYRSDVSIKYDRKKIVKQRKKPSSLSNCVSTSGVKVTKQN